MGTPCIIRRVRSLDNPHLMPYRTMRRPVEHLRQGIFVAEGDKVVRRLLDSGIAVVSLLLTPAWLEQMQQEFRLDQEAPIEVYVAEAPLLETIVGYHFHQGIMAVGIVPREISFESLPTPHLVVALDGLNQAENVGVIVRNCAAFGVDAIIAGGTSSSPYLRRAVRNSMGAVFAMPVIHPVELVASLRILRDEFRTRLVATDPHSPRSVRDAIFQGNVCIVAGSEDSGISGPVFALCDERIAIPMRKGVDSLNVANAVAVVLYEARRLQGDRLS